MQPPTTAAKWPTTFKSCEILLECGALAPLSDGVTCHPAPKPEHLLIMRDIFQIICKFLTIRTI